MKFDIEYEKEEDGRWIAEIPSLPGTMVYGQTKDEAAAKVISLALKVMAESVEIKDTYPETLEVTYINV